MKIKDINLIFELTEKDILEIFDLSAVLKKNPFSKQTVMKNKVMGLIFQKPSNRTRVSFEVAAFQLGGQCIYLGPDDIKLGVREATKDIARVLSRYLDIVVLRTFKHSDIEEFAEHASIPVINGLSERAHPCQALTDVFTIREMLGDFSGKKLCFIGDGNNVLNSLLCCAAKVGLNVSFATPKGYGPEKGVLKRTMDIAEQKGSKIWACNDPFEAIKGADVVYTDVWVSMGEEKEKEKKTKAFKGFQINKKLLSASGKTSLVMHCLPAHRGAEITDEVMDSPNSVVFDQAENRLHVQKAIITKLMERG